MRWLRQLWDRLSGRARARETCEDFARDFPDKCLICSYHRHGVTHGHVPPGHPVYPHDCIERRPELVAEAFCEMGYDEDFHNLG